METVKNLFFVGAPKLSAGGAEWQTWLTLRHCIANKFHSIHHSLRRQDLRPFPVCHVSEFSLISVFGWSFNQQNVDDPLMDVTII